MGITHWIIAQGIAFLLLMIILNKILYKPVLTHIARRNADIDAKHEKASLLAQKASELKKQYENQLNQSEENSKNLYNKVLEEARAQAYKLKEHAKIEAESVFNKECENLWKNVKSEKKHIDKEASLLAEKIITLIR